MDDATEKKVRLAVDLIDEKIKRNKDDIGYPLHHELHLLCKRIYQLLEEGEKIGRSV